MPNGHDEGYAEAAAYGASAAVQALEKRVAVLEEIIARFAAIFVPPPENPHPQLGPLTPSEALAEYYRNMMP